MKTFITIMMVFVLAKGFCQDSIYVCAGDNNLYTVNLANCTSRLIGNTKITFNDIGFTSDGRLWGIGANGLYKINPNNAKTFYVGDLRGLGVALTGLNDSILLSEYADTLYGINVNSITSYVIGYLGYSADGDLTWLENKLYMTAGNGQLSGFIVQITLNDNYTSVINSTAVNNLNNLTPSFLGITTAKINDADSLIAFVGASAYIVSHTDGSYKLFCSELNTGATFGAASMSFPSSLPIHLLNFTSTLLNNSVKLQWQTANEINSNYFSIERSADGINFNVIGKVAAAGNSATLKQYSFIDASSPTLLLAEKGVFYRLKEVDKDGKFTYSNILLVKVPQRSNISLNPNPATDRIFITSSIPVQKMEIINPQGVVVMVKSDVISSNPIFISNLSKGIYFLKVFTANEIVVKEFMKN